MAAKPPKKRRGLAPKAWAELRAAYEAGESENALSKRFGVDRKTIRSRRLRENWIPQPTPQVGEAEAATIKAHAKAKVIDIATRKAVQQAEESGAVDEAAAAAVDAVAKAAEADLLAATLAVSILTKANKGTLKAEWGIPTEAAQAKDAMLAYKIFTQTYREGAGLKLGVPTGQTEDTKKPAVLRFIIAPRPEHAEAS